VLSALLRLKEPCDLDDFDQTLLPRLTLHSTVARACKKKNAVRLAAGSFLRN